MGPPGPVQSLARHQWIAGRVYQYWAPLAGKKVLDLGCGGGILSEALATLGAAVTGIDAAEDPLAVAKLHMKNSGLEIDYRLATAERFAEEAGGRFDIVACMELLEHVPDPRSIVAACANLVKPGGDVFYATLNRNLKSFLFAIVGAEWVLRLVKEAPTPTAGSSGRPNCRRGRRPAV